MQVKKSHSVGIILFRQGQRKLFYLLLKQHQGHWSFPKGHVEKGERLIDTATRELKEEAGIKKIDFLKKKILLRDKYSFSNGKSKVNKIVDYYVAESLTDKVKIDGNEILSFKWLAYDKSYERLTFAKSKKILKKANKIINEYISDK